MEVFTAILAIRRGERLWEVLEVEYNVLKDPRLCSTAWSINQRAEIIGQYELIGNKSVSPLVTDR